MEISVIMATYKEPEYMLRQAIESILQQTYGDFEFIMILDNPQNELHKKIIKEYQEKDNRIRFYINESNMGLPETLNRAIGLTTGKYICRMDADDISLPDRLERQKRCLKTRKADLLGGITQIIDENGEELYSIKHVPVNPEKIKKALKYNQVLAHPTWFGKREVFINLGGYRKIPLCEDYDFTLRAVMQGYVLTNLDETVLKYRMTSQSLSRSNLFEQYLYARYITAQYTKNRMADIKAAARYVESKNNKKTAARYLKANVRFNHLLEDVERKRYLRFFKDGVVFTFTSVYYLDKVMRFVIVTLCS